MLKRCLIFHMNYSLIKKSLLVATILSIFVSMLLITPDKDYLKKIGALIKIKGLSGEKQHTLNLQKMRPSFRPNQRSQ